MKTVAIIPVRGGSKGIKDKNIIDLNGRPLLYYSLKECFSSPEIDYVAITTDSKKIEKIAKELFPKVIIIQRPEELASDSATSEDALHHAIIELDKQIEDIQNVLFVQATSPLSENKDFSSMLGYLKTNDSVMFYTEDYGHFVEVDNMLKPRLPRQKRKPLTREAGNAWAFKKDGFLEHKSRLFGKIGLCQIDFIKSYEVDEVEDLHLMKCLMQKSTF